MFKSFARNTKGKDYICSDIHGHFFLLEKELARVHFDESCDRLFSLGDLIDRGDESHQCLDYLAKPWFYAIQGNHERMLMNVVESDSDALRFQWFSWGGDWAEDLNDERLQDYYDAFSMLPIAIEIACEADKKVGMVHAELPDQCDWQEVQEVLLSVRPEDVERNDFASDMLWNKRQPYFSSEQQTKIQTVKNIDHVFHGHSIVSQPLTLANRTFMDLGSYKNFTLGFIEPNGFLQELAITHSQP